MQKKIILVKINYKSHHIIKINIFNFSKNNNFHKQYKKYN